MFTGIFCLRQVLRSRQAPSLTERSLRGQQLQVGGRRIRLLRGGPGQVWECHAVQVRSTSKALYYSSMQ